MRYARPALLLFINAAFAASAALPDPEPASDITGSLIDCALPGSSPSVGATKTSPIKSREDLDRYLEQARESGSPLDHFSAPARKRFLASLQFNENGLFGYRIDEFRVELTPTQTYRVLALFGEQRNTATVARDARVETSLDRALLTADAADDCPAARDGLVVPKTAHTSSSLPSTQPNPMPDPERAASDIEARFDEFDRSKDTFDGVNPRESTARLATDYQRLFAALLDTDALRRASDLDLNLLFRAARSVSYMSPQVKHVADMERILAELTSRKKSANWHFADLFDGYVQTRDLDKATALFQKHATDGMERLPDFRVAAGIESAAHTEWEVHATRRELLRRPVALPSSAHILVIGSPFCHFSKDAVAAIGREPVLGPLFRHHARWMAPVAGKIDFDDFQGWNREHPDARFTIAYKEDEWPMIDYWGTPTFYFFNGESLVTKITGWPSEGHRRELLDAARGIGLLR